MSGLPARRHRRDRRSTSDPGCFTGLRVGVATAKALGQALGLGVVGVTSLDVLAAAALGLLGPGRVRWVVAVVDARRGEVFAAAYAVGDTGSAAGGAGGGGRAPAWRSGTRPHRPAGAAGARRARRAARRPGRRRPGGGGRRRRRPLPDRCWPPPGSRPASGGPAGRTAAASILARLASRRVGRRDGADRPGRRSCPTTGAMPTHRINWEVRSPQPGPVRQRGRPVVTRARAPAGRDRPAGRGRPAGWSSPRSGRRTSGRSCASRRSVFPEPWSRRLFEEELAQRTSRAYRAAWIGRHLVGYAGQMFIDDEAHVNNVAVAPAWQGRRLGTVLLLDLVRTALRARGPPPHPRGPGRERAGRRPLPALRARAGRGAPDYYPEGGGRPHHVGARHRLGGVRGPADRRSSRRCPRASRSSGGA